MATVTVVVDPMFESDVAHWRGPYNPIGDVFRRQADIMAARVRRSAGAAARAEADRASSLASRRFHRGPSRQAYAEARVTARELDMFRRLVFAAEIRGAEGNWAAVASGHGSADTIEFGGMSRVARAGDRPLAFRAYGFLREAAGG